MLQLIGFVILAACWGLFLVIWSVGGIYNLLKAPKAEKRPPINPLTIIGILLIILLSRLARIYSLSSVISIPRWLEVIGAALLILSTALTLWARFALGTMWSNQPETKVGHQLRTHGPYQVSRHPIYTGMIGMLVGSLLVSNLSMFWMVATVIGMMILLARVPVEEKLMLETFGEQYKQYRQQVPQLIPGLQWLKKNLTNTKRT